MRRQSCDRYLHDITSNPSALVQLTASASEQCEIGFYDRKRYEQRL